MKTVLILIHHYLPGFKSGGPVQSISNMVHHLGDQIQFKIITGDRDYTEREPYDTVSINEWNKIGKADVFYLPTTKFTFVDIIRVIKDTEYDLLYLNSFFNPLFTLVPLLAKRMGSIPVKPTLLAPRGELSSGALALGKQKKRFALRLFKWIGLFKEMNWHVSSDLEKKELMMTMGVSDDAIKIALNIPAPTSDKRPSWISKQSDVLKVIFVSRIDPKKNLIFALNVLKRIPFNLEFNIVGPVGNSEYWQDCLQLIDSLPSNVNVSYKGSIPHDRIVETISQSDLFFLPTKGENYGHSIFEAAMAGTPLLISNTTPWIGLEANGVGWDLALDNVEDYVSRLRAVYEMDSSEHMNMRLVVWNWARGIQNDPETVRKTHELFLI